MAQLPGIPYTEYTGDPSTGAPGSNGGNTAFGADGASPQDLVTPTPHSFVENSYHEVAGAGAHDGVEASQVRPAFGADGMQTDTGAGHGSIGHGVK